MHVALVFLVWKILGASVKDQVKETQRTKLTEEGKEKRTVDTMPKSMYMHLLYND